MKETKRHTFRSKLNSKKYLKIEPNRLQCTKSGPKHKQTTNDMKTMIEYNPRHLGVESRR